MDWNGRAGMMEQMQGTKIEGIWENDSREIV